MHLLCQVVDRQASNNAVLHHCKDVCISRDSNDLHSSPMVTFSPLSISVFITHSMYVLKLISEVRLEI